MHEHNSGTTGVHRFTKNKYFYGKLLTVDDMATEQAYHSGVQRTLSRFVMGWGGICGLKVEPSTETDDETGQESLVVEVSEGLALDRCGRLVVVGDDQRETLPIPPEAEGVETDTVAIYVEYDECATDPVPAAKMENACEEECEDNRIVEDAEVTLVPGDPGDYHKSIAEIDFPTAEELGLGGELAGQTLDIRGDIQVEFPSDTNQGHIELTLADSGPPREVVADIVWPESDVDPTIRGTIQVPPGSLFGPDGFSFPDEDDGLDVDASLTFSGEEPIPIGGSLKATPGESSVTIDGTFRLYPDTADETPFPVDFTFDVPNSSLAVDGTVELPDGEATVENPLTISDHDDANYGLSGDLEVTLPALEGGSLTTTIETLPWTDDEGTDIPGVLVEKPTEDNGDGDDVDIDAVLAGLARSYYRNESRESCAGVDDGPVLVGVVTADSTDWNSFDFERGPLLFTNDMLYDILARHISNFDNPHEVSLGVGLSTDGVDARVGVEESGGLTGPVGLTSADDSIAITPNHRRDTIDLAAQGGLGDAFEKYHVYEQSLHTIVETYTELVEDARDVWAPDLVSHLAFRIARTAMHGIEDDVYDSPEQFLEFLDAPHTRFYSEEQIPFDRVEEAADRVIADDWVDWFPRADDYSIVDLQRLLRVALVPNDRADPAVPVRTYEEAVETLLQAEAEERSPFDIALAQHRVAETAEGVLDSYPAVEDGSPPTFWADIEQYIHGPVDETVESGETNMSHTVPIGAIAERQTRLGLRHRPVAQPTFGRGLVPEPGRAQPTGEAMLTGVIHRLIMSGWTYLLVSADADEDGVDIESVEMFAREHLHSLDVDAREIPSNQVIGQVPDPETTAHKAPGILLEVHDLVPADEIEGIGSNFKKDLARYGIDTVSEVFLAGPSVLKVATGASPETVKRWFLQAASMNRQLAWTAISNIDRETVKIISQLERKLAEEEGGRFITPVEADMTVDEIDSFINEVRSAAEDYHLADYESEILNSVDWDAVRNRFGP